MFTKELTKEQFEKEVLYNADAAMVDFYATWCGPCKMMEPAVEQIARQYPRLFVGKVNIDNELLLTSQYKIAGIPTLCFFRNGTEVLRVVGLRSKEEIEHILKQLYSTIE